MAGPDPIDAQKRKSYTSDPRTLQPSTGGVKVRDVKTESTYDPKRRRGGVSARAASATGRGMEVVGEKLKRGADANQTSGVRSVATEQYQSAGQRIARTGKSMRLAGQRVRGRKKITASRVAGKVVGRSVTLGIWSWGFFIWFWFQLPITILSIVFMALTEAIYRIFVDITTISEADSIVAAAAKYGLSALADSVTKIVNAVLKIGFGFTLDTLNPANLFLMTHVLVVLVGWGILLTIGLIYTFTGQKAFSGKGAAGKNAMFILAFVGYAIPIVNLLPLFFFWTLMVLKNPR